MINLVVKMNKIFLLALYVIILLYMNDKFRESNCFTNNKDIRVDFTKKIL